MTHPAKSGAQLLIDSLKEQGVEIIFGYPGGAIMPVYDVLPKSRLKHILGPPRTRLRHGRDWLCAGDR